ncbi:hypothetical protein LENED_006568 [Lentinula edodes]|uniref:C2H2-type domain-containing protein n=1 Tax=Lentinula edodes TaxID=5353 RepID=A0A1Q3EC51_LENED|nr:hypothetical protein LENED_006568 [Lentinula edodes]
MDANNLVTATKFPEDTISTTSDIDINAESTDSTCTVPAKRTFSRLDNLRQHAQTVHTDDQAMNEQMMPQGNGTPVPGRGGRRASKARPVTSTGYEGSGNPDVMYPGLSQSKPGRNDFSDPSSVRKKEKEDVGYLDNVNDQNENHHFDNGDTHSHRFRPQPHPHPYLNYPHDSQYGFYSSSSSDYSSTTPTPIPMASYSTSYPHHQHSTSYAGPPPPIVPSTSPSISSSSPSQSPVQDFREPEYESFSSTGGNFPYLTSQMSLGSASASAPYLPLSSLNSLNTDTLSGPGRRPTPTRLSSRTSHPRLNDLNAYPSSNGAMQGMRHGGGRSPNPRSPFRPSPLSGPASGTSPGSYFPLVPSNGNDISQLHNMGMEQQHRQQQAQRQQLRSPSSQSQSSTSLPGTPFDEGVPDGYFTATNGNGYFSHQQQRQRVPSVPMFRLPLNLLVRSRLDNLRVSSYIRDLKKSPTLVLSSKMSVNPSWDPLRSPYAPFLDTNYAASPSERLGLQAFLSEPEQELSHLDSEISRTEALLDELRAQRVQVKTFV